MNESKLAIGAFGFAADVILVITLTPTAKERVMTAAVPAIPSPVYSAPAPAGAPLSPDPDEDKSLEPITEACIKGGSPYVPPCGKVWRGNGTSGRFSICGEVMMNVGVSTPLLYLADAAGVMLFTNPVNERVTVEGYNIFTKDCRR